MSTGIYKYQNKKNGKVYIGQSINIERRYNQHLYDATKRDPFSCSGIDIAMHYEGVENFTFEIIEECPVEKLDEREKYYIQLYDSMNHGFNLTAGGDGNFQACQNYWKSHPEKMKQHIAKIQPLAAEASKKFWQENLEWKEQHLKDMQEGLKKWRQNNPEQYQNNLKHLQSKAKEWRENNKEQFELNRQKGVNIRKKSVELINTGEIF